MAADKEKEVENLSAHVPFFHEKPGLTLVSWSLRARDTAGIVKEIRPAGSRSQDQVFFLLVATAMERSLVRRILDPVPRILVTRLLEED